MHTLNFLVGDKSGQLIADSAKTFPDDYAVLGEQSPGLIDQGGARFDVALSDTVDALNIRLFRRLVRHETHVGPLHCLADGRWIIGIILRAEQARLYISGWIRRTSCPRLSMILSQYSEEAQASMPTRQEGKLAKKRTTPARLKARLSIGFARDVHAVMGKLFFARSMPMVGGFMGCLPAKGL